MRQTDLYIINISLKLLKSSKPEWGKQCKEENTTEKPFVKYNFEEKIKEGKSVKGKWEKWAGCEVKEKDVTEI